jgi:hypothetical protein
MAGPTVRTSGYRSVASLPMDVDRLASLFSVPADDGGEINNLRYGIGGVWIRFGDRAPVPKSRVEGDLR